MIQTFRNVLLLSLFVSSRPLLAAETKHHPALGAHVHGAAHLAIALEKNNKIALDLSMPGDTAVGFEHAPKNAEQTLKIRDTEDLFRKRFSELVQLPTSASCTWGNPKVEIDSTTAGHSTWDIQIFAVCAKPLAGHVLAMGFGKHFPAMKDLDVSILASDFQKKIEVPKGTGSVSLTK